MFLVINSGSSSIKFSLFDKNLDLIINGKVRFDLSPHIMSYTVNSIKKEIVADLMHNNHIELIIDFLISINIIKTKNEINYYCLRVVYVQNFFGRSAFVNDEIIQSIKDCTYLSPVHNTYTLKLIEEIKNANELHKVILISDSWFHQSIKKEQYVIPINQNIADKYNIRKYGFHGISYEYASNEAKKFLNNHNSNLIILHLGNGSSICAIKDGESFDTTMSYTPLSGLIMNTRSGDIDPSIILTLAKKTNQTIEEIIVSLNKQSGIYGLSNYKSLSDAINNLDYDQEARLGFDLFIDKIIFYLLKYYNDLKSVDAIVFTGGIAEYEQRVIKEIIKRINLINLDIVNNWSNYENIIEISTQKSNTKLLIIKTNEEYQMAKNALEFIKERK